MSLAAAVLRSTKDSASQRLAAALLLQLARHRSLRARLLAFDPWLSLAQAGESNYIWSLRLTEPLHVARRRLQQQPLHSASSTDVRSEILDVR
eukprot:COSAG05_NODE_4799_length_1366_cov_1.812155_2_plen_93_part_00